MANPAPTVLIIDHDQDIRTLAQQALEDGGYAVVTAADCAEALVRVREQSPDLILIDLRAGAMPDGFAEIYPQLPAPRAPILVISRLFWGSDELSRLSA